MPFSNLLQIALKALNSNKVRTVLTLLGIVIGIGSVIALIALGDGVTNSITGELSALGTNTLTVSPGASNSVASPVSGRGGPSAPANIVSNSNLVFEDEVLDTIENRTPADLFTAISPTLASSFEITFRNKAISNSVQGITSDYYSANSVELESGELLTNTQLNTGAKVAIIPIDVEESLFPDSSAVGQSVDIDGVEFEVVGVSSGAGFGLSRVLAPIDAVRNFLTKSEGYSNISVVATEGNLNNLEDSIKSTLLRFYNIDDEENANFNISSSEDLLATAATITGLLQTLLVSIAAISLVVGGIGIMNIMLVTVSERTKEIGLRKAVGAKVADILAQFLTESVVVTLIGGLLGILLGWLSAIIIGVFTDIEPVFTASSVLLAFGVSGAVGIVFGFYPAWVAARMQPIDALRSE